MPLKNRHRLIARTCAILASLLSIAVFLPSWAGIDGFNGGFALSTLFGFLAMLLFVSAYVYQRLAKEQDRLLEKSDFLVHWTYSDAEWLAFAADDYAADKREKKILFFMIGGFAIFFGILWPIFDHKAGFVVSGAMIGLIAFTGCIAWLSAWLPHHRNLKTKGEAFIGRQGAFLNGRMHAWRMLGGRLKSATFKEGSPAQVVIIYSTPGGKGRQSYTARIPVPAGHEDEARKVAFSIGQN